MEDDDVIIYCQWWQLSCVEGNNRVLEQGCSKNYHAGSGVLSDNIDFHDNSMHLISVCQPCLPVWW